MIIGLALLRYLLLAKTHTASQLWSTSLPSITNTNGRS